MMFLAKKRDSVPRDLGLDLLILKDKAEKETPSTADLAADCKVLSAKPQQAPFAADPCGVFRILIDREGGKLFALHYAGSSADKPLHVICGCRR